ncbi:hypothetical protein MBLNU459_g7845t2 [Dothideomycetes sp. NU459]
MDPAVVDSASFGLLWKNAYNSKEQFYAKPLVFTPNGQNQLVFLASSQNWIRTLDAKTGVLINSRQVQTPFLQSDIGCTDIPNYIGIIGTPVIDPNTEIAYFYAKTYIPNFRIAGDTGVFNGVYYFYAVNVNTLEDVPGFPILVDGSVADNDARKYFVGGTILQRPSLLQIGNYVYAGFGGHCDLYNYTGTVLGVDIVNKKVVTNFAVESGPNSAFTTNYMQNAGGGQGGIWQSGMGLSSDGVNRLFFATGNGVGGENQGNPATGSSGCRTLGETVINLAADSATGKLSLVDYFQPYDYVNMDGGDRDFGSGGVALLDPTVFKGTGVSQMAVTTGKNGKIYFMNANNLGGYKQGPGQTDGVLQTIATNEAVFGGIGSYPLEGGYIYSTPVGYPTTVYKLGFTDSGVPFFSKAGATPENSAGRVGPGIPTITSYKGQAGTAIMWTTDPDAGLRAWYAIPQADGTLKRINLPQTGGSNKFLRPVFGDTRLYTTDANVNLPLNCTSPVSFGTVLLGEKATAKVSCTALIGITEINSVSVSDAHFVVDQTTVPTGAVAKGSTFSINVTWDLTNTTVSNAANASFGNTSPGIKSAALTIVTTNSLNGYATSFPVSLTGTEQSKAPFLDVSPANVDFGGLVLGVSGEAPSSTLAFSIANLGSTDLTITGYAYTTDETDDTDIDFTNATYSSANKTWDLGQGFTAAYLPSPGTVLAAGEAQSIPAVFTASEGSGDYLSYFYVWSDGGKDFVILEGSASTAPVANFSISNGEGGWLPGSDLLMDFGTVVAGETVTRQIRICNSGGSVLTITKSKPPLGDIRALNYGVDLHESQQIDVNTCAYGDVIFNPGAEPVNILDFTDTNAWTLNTDDLTFGVHVIQMTGVVHDRYVGPLKADGTPRYVYLGCYQDLQAAGATRLLPQQLYTDIANNTNQECQSAAASAGYVFTATEYHQECWAGDTLPSALYFHPESDDRCTWTCPGDVNQTCGGDGGYMSVFYDSTKYTVTNQTYNASATATAPTPAGPVTVQTVGAYAYIGCYSEATNQRALSDKAPAVPSAGGSVDYCASQCVGYHYFGVEYANECYCGNTINAGSVSVTVSDCNMVCGGNATEYCGAGNRLDMYSLGNATTTTSTTTSSSTSSATTSGPVTVQTVGVYSYIGCYSEATNERALSDKTPAIPSTGGSVDYCAAQCEGYHYFGVEYANECYCGNTINAGSVSVTVSDCNMVCGGNATEYCGAGNRLDMYSLGNATSTSSSSAASSTSSGAPSTTSAATSGSSAKSAFTNTTTTTATTAGASQPTSLSCPANNGTLYTAASGAQFQVECGIDHAGGDLSMVYVSGLIGCITACANTTSCIDVSLSGTACYLKSTLGSAIANTGILGAKLVTAA